MAAESGNSIPNYHGGVFRQLFDTLPWPSFLWRREGDDFRLTSFNRAAADQTDVSEIAGVLASDLYPRDSEQFRNLDRCVSQGETIRWEADFEYVSGDTRRLATTLVPLSSETLVVHTDDVTARRRAADTLRESENRLKSLFSKVPDVVLRMSADGCFLDAYAASESQLAVPRDELIGKAVRDFYGESAHADQVRLSRRAIETGEMQFAEYDIEWRNGEHHRMESRFVASGPDEVIVYVRDVTERAALENEFTKLIERERSALEQALHEGLAQQLVGIRFVINRCADKLNVVDPDLASSVSLAQDAIEKAIILTRDIAMGLGSLPEGITLTDALRELGRHSRETANVECSFDLEGIDRPLGQTFKVHVYRIAQEAIANAVRHGGATDIRLSAKLRGEGFELVVADNGSGLAHIPVEEALGLRIVRYRARAIGAEADIGNRPEGGAYLIARASRAIVDA